MTIPDDDSALQIVEAGRARVHARLRDAIENQVDAHPDLVALDPETIDQLAAEATERAGAPLWRLSLAEGAADLYGIALRDALADPAVAAAEQLLALGDDATGSGAAPEPWVQWGAEPETEPQPVVPEPGREPEPWVPEPDPEPWVPEPDPQPVVPEPEPVVPEPEPVVPEPVVPDPQPAVPEPAPAIVPPEPAALRVPVIHRGGIDSIKNGDKDIELRLSGAGLDVLKRSSGAALGRLDWTIITGIEVAQPKSGRGRRKRKAQSLQVHTAAGEATFELVDLTPEQVDAQIGPMLEHLRETGALPD